MKRAVPEVVAVPVRALSLCLDFLSNHENSAKQTPPSKASKFVSRISQVKSVKNFFVA